MGKPILEHTGITRKMAQKLPSKTKKIIKGIIILLAISVIIAILGQLNTRSVNLTAEFSSVSEGLNPDGSPFDVQEILCDEVLNNSAEKLGGKFSMEEMRRHMNITQYTSSQDRQKLINNIREGNNEYISVPTVYKLSIHTISDEIRAEGFFSCCKAIFKHIFSPSKKKILNTVTECFEEYYIKKYVNTGEGLKVNWEETDSLDYYNKANSTINIAGRLSRIITEKYNKDSEFVSADKNISYGELRNEINSLIGVELENYKSFIVKHGLTNDRENLLRQFKYMEDYNNETNERLIKRYSVIKDAINFYDSDVTKVVFIPALDLNDSFYMNRTKVGIDYLVEKGKTSKIAADDAEHNKINYQYLTSQFESSSDADESAYAQADTMYENIKTKINEFSKKAIEVIEEENVGTRFVNVKISDTYLGTGIVSMGIKAAKIFIVLMLLSYLVVFAYEIIKKKWEESEKC